MEKTIYKLDSKGKERFLTVKAEVGDLVQISGLVGTDSPVEHRKTCKAKNVGKSNETTPQSQALLEAEAKWKTKIDEGYFESLEEAKNTVVVLPMLAKSFDKEAKKIDWKGDVYVQPKLDGMRALNIKGNLISRKGKLIENMEHITKELKEKFEGWTIDGELYAHGKTFQENMKLIKKYRPNQSEEVKFHIYDIVSTEGYKKRNHIITDLTKFCEQVVLVPTYKISSKEELDTYHAQFISEGYEGSIVRHGNSPYKVNGRSSDLLKYKDFKDIAVKVVDVVPAEQRGEWGVPVLELEDGRTFRSGVRLSHDERKDLLTNKQNYIGQIAEIRYFEETDDGLPRFPVMVGFRLDR